VDTAGEFITKSPPLPISLSNSVKVKKVLIKNNTRVKKGDSLLYLSSYISPNDFEIIQSTFNHLKTNVEAEKNKKCSEQCQLFLKMLSQRGFPFLSKIDTNADFYRELNDLLRYLKDYQSQLNLIEQLPATTASIQNEINMAQKKINAIVSRKAEKILSFELEELKSRVINLKSQYKEKILSSQSALEASRNNLEVILTRIPKTLSDYTANSTVFSPGDGLITFAEFKGEGQVINPGQNIFLLHSSTSNLKVNLKLPDTEISKVKSGMSVRLDVSSYPATEFGIQEATITEIPEKVNFNGQAKDNFFDVFAELKEPTLISRGKTYEYRSGMTAKAKIIVKHERVLTYYYKKLLSIKDDALGN
jgi:multidrug resistance efflux pump